MDFNTNYLKYFIDTAENKSTLQASRINFVSQPAISQGIKKLEEQLDLKLLKHKKNTIKLTSDGQFVFKHSKQIFSSIENFKNSMQEIQNNIAGNLNIATSSSIAQDFLTSHLSNYSKKYPKVEMNIKLGKTLIQKQLIDDGQSDVGITIDDGGLVKYSTYVILKGNFVLVGKKKCPSKLLVTEQRPEVKKLLKNIFKEHKDLSSNIIEIESWSLIYKFILNSFGYGFIPDFIISSNKSNFNYIKIPKIEYKVVLFHRSDLDLPFHAKILMESF